MKLKLDEAGHVVVQDGMPVYTHDDGKDSPFDAVGTVSSLESRKAAAKMLEKRAVDAETKLKAFDGIDDPESARKAITTIANIDAKKLIDAGQVEVVKAENNKAWESKFRTVEERATKAEERANAIEAEFHGELVGGGFARSKYIPEKTTLTPDVAQSWLGKNFRVEDRKVRAYDNEGNPIFSRKNPNIPADFDEAIEILVDAYPRKESILRATNGSGSGARQDGGGGQQGAKTKDRASFDKLNVQDKHKFVSEGGTVTD